MVGNMLEKRFIAVPPQSFTSDGTANGVITIADNACALFKVKQRIILMASTLPNLELEIKEIDSEENIRVGPIPGKPGINSGIDARSDISAYTIALGATISANIQKRPAIDNAEIVRATYQEEPAVALRSILVDECGDTINDDNPLPIAFDGSISIGDVSIVEGGNTLDVNNDGSINVNIVSSASSAPGLAVSHQEISSVVSGVETTLYTFTTPTSGFKLYKVEVSGENIALYKIYIDSNPISSKRTFFGQLNTDFTFQPFTNGLELTSGQVLKVTVLHSRPFTGNFEVTIMGLNL